MALCALECWLHRLLLAVFHGPVVLMSLLAIPLLLTLSQHGNWSSDLDQT